MKLDYKLLEALNAVVECQSFERAAAQLFVTQSAVSQRIKQLEELVGHSALVRGKPVRLTDMGSQLLSHYKKVQLLEQDLIGTLLPEAPEQTTKLSFSVNADGLAIWFMDAIQPLLQQYPIELDILVSGESHTIDKLRSGEAFAGVCLQPEPISGFKAEYLGDLHYVLVASPQFSDKHFAAGLTSEGLRHAPGVAFDPMDSMHHRFIQEHFGLLHGDYPCHFVRSSEAFVDMAVKGMGYCLIPEPQIRDLIVSGTLIDLLPQSRLVEQLYWHSWVLSKGIYREATQRVIAYARQHLPQSLTQ